MNSDKKLGDKIVSPIVGQIIINIHEDFGMTKKISFQGKLSHLLYAMGVLENIKHQLFSKLSHLDDVVVSIAKEDEGPNQ